MERLEAETYISPVSGPDVAAGVPLPLGDPSELLPEISEETKQLISKCLDGTEPTGRELKPWENLKFNAANVNVVLLRAAGFKQGDVAKILEIDPARVSVICTHPYGQKIIQSMLHNQGTRVLDIKIKLAKHAESILDHMVKLALAAEDVDSVAKVGFGLLDRTGHGPTHKIESKNVTTTLQTTADSATLNRLSSALEGSKKVDSVMTTFVQKGPPADGGSDSKERDPFASEERESLRSPAFSKNLELVSTRKTGTG